MTHNANISLITGQPPLELLLIEDDPGDVDLIREALKASSLPVRLRIVDDGVKALAYLRREGEFSVAALPQLILLDLNLPKKDGCEVLRAIKTSPNLRKIPVVVLTTSDAQATIIKAYELDANCYVVKPVGFEEFARAVKAIEEFWLTLVQLPSE